MSLCCLLHKGANSRTCSSTTLVFTNVICYDDSCTSFIIFSYIRRVKFIKNVHFNAKGGIFEFSWWEANSLADFVSFTGRGWIGCIHYTKQGNPHPSCILETKEEELEDKHFLSHSLKPRPSKYKNKTVRRNFNHLSFFD